jgi:uncharacterized iron-regulated membrane protein
MWTPRIPDRAQLYVALWFLAVSLFAFSGFLIWWAAAAPAEKHDTAVQAIEYAKYFALLAAIFVASFFIGRRLTRD